MPKPRKDEVDVFTARVPASLLTKVGEVTLSGRKRTVRSCTHQVYREANLKIGYFCPSNGEKCGETSILDEIITLF